VLSELAYHLSTIAQILFFLMGAMTIVELVDAHHCFRFITDRIRTMDMAGNPSHRASLRDKRRAWSWAAA
jgi:Na+/H+ antiporter NhaD/arsenite permease-like protein